MAISEEVRILRVVRSGCFIVSLVSPIINEIECFGHWYFVLGETFFFEYVQNGNVGWRLGSFKTEIYCCVWYLSFNYFLQRFARIKRWKIVTGRNMKFVKIKRLKIAIRSTMKSAKNQIWKNVMLNIAMSANHALLKFRELKK